MNLSKIKNPNVFLRAGNLPDTDDIHGKICYDNSGEYVSTFIRLELTEEDLKSITESKSIHIGVMGRAFPPVRCHVEDPEELGFVRMTEGEVKRLYK